MNGLIGLKVGMTSVYEFNGNNVACTVVETGPCVVTQVKQQIQMVTLRFSWVSVAEKKKILLMH